MKHILPKWLCTFLLLVSLMSVVAQPGTLDKSFGNGGIVISEDYIGFASGVVIQPDGKIITAGVGGYDSVYGFLAVRYFPDGTLDSSFGNKGRALIEFEPIEVADCALQQDGKLLVAGTIAINEHGNAVDVALVRFNSNGSVDKSFGEEGKVITNVGYDDRLEAISVQDDGKILVSGYIFELNDDDTAFAIRYNTDGSIDSSYATKSIFEYTILGTDLMIAGHTLDKDGNLFIAGDYFFSSTVFVLKLNKDGILDKNFGVNGEVIYPDQISRLADVALQSDGKIILSGIKSDLINHKDNFTVLRMNKDGSEDKSFGVDGLATIIGEITVNDHALMLQKNDEIILAGSASPDNYYYTYYPALSKFKNNGVTDSIFGKNGLSVTVTESNAEIYDIALQDDGKIVVTGAVIIQSEGENDEEQNPYHFFLARYENDNGTAHFYVKIKQWLHRHGFTWDDCPKRICNDFGYYSVQRSTNSNSFNEVARVYRNDNQQHYSYTDAAPSSGTNYYRLATISSDGSAAYSNVIAIEDNEAAIKIYPNPVKDNLHIEGLSSTQKTKLTITDFSGIVKTATTVTGNSYNWNIAQLKPGNYMLRVEINGSAAVTKKFVKE